jgi:hypothetical protein
VRLSLKAAFDLEPVLELRIGPWLQKRTYRVPPLTFGRFDELTRQLGLLPQLRASLLAAAEKLKDIPSGPLSRAAMNSFVGRHLMLFPVSDFFPLAKAVVPGLKEKDWAQASLFDLNDLFLFFARTHDWSFIAEAMGFGQPRENACATDEEAYAALLGMAIETGQDLSYLLNLRVEAFFTTVVSLRLRHELLAEAREEVEHEAEGWTGPRPADQVLPFVKDPEKAANLQRLMEEADARAASVMREAAVTPPDAIVMEDQSRGDDGGH